MLPKFTNIIQLVQRFPTERSCHEYLSSRRWQGYMQCPHDGCAGDTAYVFNDGIRYKCKTCKTIYTARTGTMMEGSKIAMTKWFVAIYLVMHKKGISSVQLAKDIGVTQKSAWFLLHRIRTVLGNAEAQYSLEGTVQLDETFVGGKNKNRHADKKVKNSQGRAFIDKTPVMGMLMQQEIEVIERPHKLIKDKIVKEKIVISPSFVKCRTIQSTSSSEIQREIHKSIAHGSTLVSDEWKAYRGLNSAYDHHVIDHTKKQYVDDQGYTTNAIEGFWSLCKRSIIGIYHKATRKHMNKYFYEFSFRYNYRNFGIQEQLDVFIENMQGRLKYKELIA